LEDKYFSEKMQDYENYFFKSTDRIDGYLYIKDGNGNFVGANGKKLKFKTTSRCAETIYDLEYARNKQLTEEK
jgi:hypothetical protein